jgi:hypothetical protein
LRYLLRSPVAGHQPQVRWRKGVFWIFLNQNDAMLVWEQPPQFVGGYQTTDSTAQNKNSFSSHGFLLY